jgi:hypothetical protein
MRSTPSISAEKRDAMNNLLYLPLSRIVASFLVVLCFLSLVDAVMPQLELYLLGEVVIREGMVKAAFFIAVLLGCLVYPRIKTEGAPITIWLLCAVYLVADVAYLTYGQHMSFLDVLQSYSVYYLLLLIGPALVAFRGRISHSAMVRWTVFIFLVCAAIGIAQHLTAQPLLHTDSADGAFRVDSWNFFDEVRAFSLFTTALNFGIFCALCGALGVALSRTFPIRGALLFVVAAVASFTTLTRLSYVIFICTCAYAAVLVFGKKAKRGLWHPLLFFAFGMITILIGLNSLANSDTANLKDASSLLERVGQWIYYSDLIRHSSLTDQLFGIGIVQNENILPLYPMLIDDLPLALLLHIGIVGLLLFGILMIKMWLYLRREALATRQPFVVAAASLWAAFACAGIFNIVTSSFGAVFALAILCRREDRPTPTADVHRCGVNVDATNPT